MQEIGVIGIGSLGSRLVCQIESVGKKAIVFDARMNESDFKILQEVISPLHQSFTPTHIEFAKSAEEVMSRCSIVHWAIPSDKLEEQTLNENHCVILHDSVMSNSVRAIDRTCGKHYVISHCLMNEAGRVLISSEYGDYETAFNHFFDLGLQPQYMNTQNHDDMMARSQGIFALLINMGLGRQLDEYNSQHNLTPSSSELLRAIKHRESNWTDPTIDSILTNPELASFLKDVSKALERKQKLSSQKSHTPKQR